MGFFPPKAEVIYRSNLSAEEVLQRLSEKVEPQKSFGFGWRASYSTPYMGNIFGNSFRIRRVINYRNSFLPSIEGEISPAMSGSRIKVAMKPEPVVKIFMMIWLAGVTFGCIAILTTLFNEGPKAFIAIPFFMLGMGFLMFYFGFKVEADRSKKDLAEIFEAKIESE